MPVPHDEIHKREAMYTTGNFINFPLGYQCCFYPKVKMLPQFWMPFECFFILCPLSSNIDLLQSGMVVITDVKISYSIFLGIVYQSFIFHTSTITAAMRVYVPI